MRRVLLLLVLTFPLAAQQLPRNEFTVSAGWTNFNGRATAPAFGASYSRFWSDSISTRAGVFTAKRDYPDEAGGERFRAIHADVGLHFRRARVVSPRFSVGVARVSLDVTPYESESDTGTELIGATGVDFKIRPNFALGVEALYIPFTPNPRDRFASKLNPLTAFASARVRW